MVREVAILLGFSGGMKYWKWGVETSNLWNWDRIPAVMVHGFGSSDCKHTLLGLGQEAGTRVLLYEAR